MLRQMRHVDLHEIGLHMLYDPVAHRGWEKIDNGGVNLGRRRE